MLLLLPQKNHWYLRWFCSIHYENCPKHRYLCSFWTRRYKTLFFALFLRHRHRHVVKIAVLSSLLSPPCPKQTSQKHWRLWQFVAFLHNKKHQKKSTQFFLFFQLVILRWKIDIFGSVFATVHPAARWHSITYCQSAYFQIFCVTITAKKFSIKMTWQPVWTQKSCKSLCFIDVPRILPA